jgi:hypothetical protein
MRKLLLAGSALLWMLSGCSSAPRPASTPEEADSTDLSEAQEATPQGGGQTEPMAPPKGVKRLWGVRYQGLITDLTPASRSERILVTVVPDSERPGAGENRTLLVDGRGRTLWSRPNFARVRAQALSPDGKMAVLATYDDELLALDSRGKLLWARPAHCRPVLLSAKSPVFCHQDDSVRPGVVYQLFSNRSGQEIRVFPANRDPLIVKVADDSGALLVGMSDGEFLLLDSDFEVQLQKRVPLDWLDLAISNELPEGGRRILALGRAKKEAVRELRIWDQAGREIAQKGLLGFIPDGVDFLEKDSSRVVVHGVGPQGQTLMGLERETLKRVWKRTLGRAGDALQSWSTVGSTWVAAAQDTSGQGRAHRIRFLGWDAQRGRSSFRFEDENDEGAYGLWSVWTSAGPALAVIGDSGELSVWAPTAH